MDRVHLPESRVRRIRRRRRIRIAGVIVVFLLIIAGGLVWLSWAPFLRITNIEVSGTQTLSSSTVTAMVGQEISGSYFHLFAKNNIALYPKGHIVSALAAVPVVTSAEVHAVNFHTIAVSILERQPVALWCGSDAPNASSTPEGGGCLLLDQNGVAYASSASSSISGYETYYGTLSGDALPEQFLTPSEFQSLSALIGALAQNQGGNPIISVAVDQNDDVHVAFADGFTLLFALSSDGGDVYQNFTLALTTEPFTTHPLSDFEYLDLRFGDKLYYKLKDASQ